MSTRTAKATPPDAPDHSGAPPAFGGGEPPDRDALAAAPLRSLPRPSILTAPVSRLRGAGPRLAAAAAEIGIETLGDVVWHLPHSHRDLSRVARLGELRTGEEATVLVEVSSARLIRTRRRNLKIVEAKVADDSGPATAVWFGRAWLAERLRPGTRALLRGRLDRRGFVVSAQELLGGGGDGPGDDAGDGPASSAPRPLGAPGDRPPPGLHTTGTVPVHPASEALRPQRLREWAWQAAGLARHAIEPLPAEIRARRRLPAAADALAAAHFPRTEADAAEARRRLAFEELFLYSASLASRRAERRRAGRAAPLPGAAERVAGWLASLPFEPTSDQRRAMEEIDADLRSERPMQRLLMGEVGSGKTVVALYAMLRAVESGGQAALMAPTETLAEQHFATLEALLAAAPLPAALLTGAKPAAHRRECLQRLASGELGLVVGTHALIEPAVDFARLTVAVVDEQHRFGVRQRAALDDKGTDGLVPHTLHLTATPIPRTLSLTAYGDLDVTALRELPAGRRPVRTWVVGEEKRGGAYEFLRERLREGRQAYVVCPLVGTSEAVQARAATEEGERLASGELRDFTVEVLHGQLPSERKAEAMARFAAGEVDVLVATTVIEVGIDVPNATVMVVEDAERYGLSQLHQLRGRVGRGEHPSACILFAGPDSEGARRRLEAIATERDGFKLAEVDLAIRGEGEILGTRQHGLPRFRAAVLPEDMALLLEAREEIAALLRTHGSLEAAVLGPLMDGARAMFGDEREQIAA